jgi:hypothetical protein
MNGGTAFFSAVRSPTASVFSSTGNSKSTRRCQDVRFDGMGKSLYLQDYPAMPFGLLSLRLRGVPGVPNPYTGRSHLACSNYFRSTCDVIHGTHPERNWVQTCVSACFQSSTHWRMLVVNFALYLKVQNAINCTVVSSASWWLLGIVIGKINYEHAVQYA